MKSLTSWLLVFFMFLFWVFRIIVALQSQYGDSFGGFIAFNFNVEVILLFLTVLCFILIVRRYLIGGILYLVSYGYYFGSYLLSNILVLLDEGGSLSMTSAQNMMAAAIGLFLAICVFADIFIEKARRRDPKDKKTDWFFKGTQYDRKYDERADRNQYRNY